MEKEKKIEIIKSTVIDYVQDLNVNNGDIPAFESLGGSSISHKTSRELEDLYAKAFLEIGVKRGDIVTICTAGTLDTYLYFAGLNKIGAVAQFVNPNYFKVNSKKYINDTNCKLLICLDKFYPAIKEEIGQTNVQQVMISSISEYASDLVKKMVPRMSLTSSDKIDGIKYLELPEFTKKGELSNIKLEKIPYVPDMPAVITYTSGTTGNPKGVVHTNDSLNTMLATYQIADGFGATRGGRNLVVIPPMYLTSFMHSIIGPASVGATSIFQPVYNPKALADDLQKYEPETVVASKAHYINLEDANLPAGSLSKTRRAYCGGEAFFPNVAARINRILEYLGIEPLINCYGATEFGTMVMYNRDIPNRVNEAGILIPGVKAEIVDLVTGEPVERGKLGALNIYAPAAMKEYLDNPEATEKFFFTKPNGERWARTGDIAAITGQFNGKDVYDVSGRITDSFVDENKNVVYLFNIENKVEQIPDVREAEVVALTVDGKKVVVVHVVLAKDANISEDDILHQIDASLKETSTNSSEIPYAYKVRDAFATSPISGKRNYDILKFETDGYKMLNEFGKFETIKIESEESKVKNDLLHSQIMLKK